MTFNAAPDYETKNSYEVTLNVSDGALSAAKNLTISITDSTADNTFACKTASYSALPAADSSDSVMNYYSYSWQYKSPYEYLSTYDSYGPDYCVIY